MSPIIEKPSAIRALEKDYQVKPSVQPGIWLLNARNGGEWLPVAMDLEAIMAGMHVMYGVDPFTLEECTVEFDAWRDVYVYIGEMIRCEACMESFPADLAEKSDLGHKCCSPDCALSMSSTMCRQATAAGV